MTPRERVWAALSGAPVDRPPVSFWGHVYDRESSAQDLVEAALANQREFAWDWVKLNPRKHYHVEPWGVSYRYGSGRTVKPVLEAWPIHEPDDWAKVTERRHGDGALGEQLEAVRLLKRALPAEVPFVETVFTPLAILGEMVHEPQVLAAHLKSHPDQVRRALEAVTRTFERFAAEAIAAGADGIYLATVDWGTRDFLTAEELRTWSRPYDLRILRAASQGRFNVLHVCKQRNLLLEMLDYPVHAFSWAATDPTNPTIPQVLENSSAAVMGGISHDEALAQPSPDAALSDLRRGFDLTRGRRWLVAPGCSISPAVAPAHLHAIRSAVETISVSPGA